MRLGDRKRGETMLDTTTEAAASADLPRIWHLFGDEGIGQRLLLLAKMIERETTRHLQGEFGLSLAQWRVLAFVCMSGPATASFIGEAAEVDQAEISRAVKGLGERGWIVREFVPGSRKSMIIAPTEEGRRRFETIRAQRRAYFDSITAGLDRPLKRAFSRILDLMASEVVAERAGRS
jgi:DNA-binding MarR family transcriptional regulator